MTDTERALLDHPECVHPDAPRSVSREPVVPVRVVLETLAALPRCTSAAHSGYGARLCDDCEDPT